ncbi:monovalent cation/H+ antiporter complex subunit F [Brachybacterium saurashtrense]|uniref:Sodium:proton antiporter n=1 Tax=Brachybacterium saurashtrense TaxID=556288 RepID=A0A345YPW9_9MICO|nr:monovalent cation/H+ antiporter complex subunit F [Brachybacterium saurashtrense]AXK45971.1 hypothetical protein DWV08_10375 [Brachybacterium saurashtrense]RRR23710.1 hypothetical protein DXU92_02125 [Brachybacterium saurashtrense]
MSAFEILLLVCAAVLAAAALAVTFRMIVGPTILDRAIASDSLVTLVVMGMALYAAGTRTTWAGPVMLALTGLAFIGTVTFARFVAREDLHRGVQRPHVEEPATETAAHEAVHFGPFAQEPAGPEHADAADGPVAGADGPVNRAGDLSGLGAAWAADAAHASPWGEEGSARWGEETETSSPGSEDEEAPARGGRDEEPEGPTGGAR